MFADYMELNFFIEFILAVDMTALVVLVYWKLILDACKKLIKEKIIEQEYRNSFLSKVLIFFSISMPLQWNFCRIFSDCFAIHGMWYHKCVFLITQIATRVGAITSICFLIIGIWIFIKSKNK